MKNYGLKGENSKTHKWILIGLIGLIIFINIQWFNIFGQPLTDGDFFYIPIDALKTMRAAYFSTWLSDFGMGRALIDLSQAPTYSLPGFLAQFLNVDYSTSARIIYFLPILFFGIFGTYKLVGYFTKNNYFLIAIGISIYLLNTYSLTLQTGHITLAVAYNLLPLALFNIIKGFEENISRNLIYGIILFLLMGYYETRILFISGFIILCFSLTFIIKKYKGSIKNSIILFSSIILGNLFWILPFKFLGFNDGEVLDRPLFGSGYWDIIHSISLHQSWWSGIKGIQIFIESNVPIYLLIIPIIFCYCLLYIFNIKKTNHYEIFIPFAFITFLGIFLGKMSSPPLINFYQWMYENFPFFNAFREPTKFFILSAVGYTIIITCGLNIVPKKNKNILGCIIIGIGLINLVIHGLNNRELLAPKTQPAEYRLLEDLLANDNGFGRVLWVPSYSRWGYYSKKHPPINFIETGLKYFPDDSVKKDIYLGINFFENFESFFASKSAEKKLYEWGVNYIVVPLQEATDSSDMFYHYGGAENEQIRKKYIEVLQRQAFLNQISNDNKLVIFKSNNQNKSKILLKSGDVNIMNETQTSYEIILNLNGKEELTMLESFHPQWKPYLNSRTSSIKGKLSKLWKKPIFDNTHKKAYDYANQWTIDPEYIKKNYSKEYYKENSDGSIDVNITLYFKPQSYFHLGLLISGATSILLIGYLGYDSLRNRRKRV